MKKMPGRPSGRTGIFWQTAPDQAAVMRCQIAVVAAAWFML
jgi:hypothetical protein